MGLPSPDTWESSRVKQPKLVWVKSETKYVKTVETREIPFEYIGKFWITVVILLNKMKDLTLLNSGEAIPVLRLSLLMRRKSISS